MTTLTDTQVITASGGLVELGYSEIIADVNVVSTTAGSGTPVISALTVVCDGGPILVEFFAPGVVAPSTSGGQIFISLYQDGSEKSRYWSNTSNPAAAVQYAPVHLQYRTTPSAGSHTFDVRSFVSSTTGTPRVSASSTTTGNAPAFLRVSKIVQATQWPAVTTGTIICTSSTRPASPFEGQTIYETDTKRSWTRVGTQWIPDDMVFTNEAARDAAITSPTEGMRAYLTAPTVPAATGGTTSVPTGVVTIYNGSAWVCVTPVSAIQTATGTTTSGTYTATLTGGGTNASVTLTTGTTALLMLSVTGSVSPAPTTIAAGVAVSGATTRAVAGDSNAVYVGISGGYIGMMSCAKVITGLTAGSNTFTIQYLSGAGNTASFYDRSITVQGIA